ncbi:MAG: cysteine desulfurase family protein [Phaeospirillum sp.]|nr:cysteine desulfurase family protein [Phaeospirillum sp.]
MTTEDPIYLDFNATTPIDLEVVEAMLPFLRTHFGNPSSGHIYGHRAREAIEHARAQVAALIGARPSEIVFTGSGTEANNMALRGAACAHDRGGRMACSAIEHPAVAKPCQFLGLRGWAIATIPVDETGLVDMQAADAAIRHGTVMVSVMHSNNEIGTIQPIRALADLAHSRGALMHTDAAQSVGKVSVNVNDLGVDALTIVGHKLYAPKGIGALYIRKGAAIAPTSFGGGQEGGMRPGTENVALIVALGAACGIARRNLAEDEPRLRTLRDRLWSRLQADIPGIRLNGHPEWRLPNTLNVSFPGVRGNAVLTAAPNLAASTGSACHEGEEAPSSVLTEMGCCHERALGAVRLSVGRTTMIAEVDSVVADLVKAWQHVRARTANGGK